MKKKVGVFLTAVFFIFSSVIVTVPCPVGAAAQGAKGITVRNVFSAEWNDGFSVTYDYETNTMTLRGKGAFHGSLTDLTEDYRGNEISLFLHNRTDTLVIEDGITDFGEDNCNNFSYTDNIIVGKDCKNFPKAHLSYEIDPQNPYFASYDGALYNKELTKLLFLPEKITSIDFPPNLQVIGNEAIIYSDVDPLVIPWGVTTIEGENFSRQTGEVIIPDTLINHSDAKIEFPNGFFTVCSENNQEREFWKYEATQAFGPINATKIVHNAYGITPNTLKTFQNGKTYYFDQNCKMAKGWKQASGNWYYFNDYGAAVVKIWLKSGNKWYFMQADGTMATNKWVQWYGKWYYVGSDGAMYANRYTPDGYWVNGSGVWVK